MAKTNAPLLSWAASGKIADTQVYSTWKGRPYVRRYVVPANPNSPAQQLTRNTFSFLNSLWKFMPAGAIGAWSLYAQNSRITPQNGFMKLNISPLRAETDLNNITLSVSANSGLPAADFTPTPTSDGFTCVLTAPPLPTGWTIVRGYAMAVQNVNPQSSNIYQIAAGDDAAAPYEITLTGLDASTEYVVGGWFEYLRSNGTSAFGVSLQDVASTTA